MSTWTDVKNQILQKLPDAGINVISPKRLRESLYAIIDQTIASTPDPVEFEWKATDGLGNSVTYNIGDPVIDDNRWFIAIAENTNKKPVLPDGSINVDFWQEENASTTRYIDIWEAKLYTYPVEIVLHNKKLYLLDRDVVGAAPFLSSDIVAEIAAEPSKWFNLTEASGGSSVTIEQTRSQSTTAVPSSKLLDDELNKFEVLDSIGSEIVFDRPRQYGTDLAPITTTTLTDSGAKRVIQKIYHQAASLTVPASWKKLASSADYDPAVVNIIFVEYESDTRKIYSITKDA